MGGSGRVEGAGGWGRRGWGIRGGGGGSGGPKERANMLRESGESGRDVCSEEWRCRGASTTRQRRYATPDIISEEYTPQFCAGVPLPPGSPLTHTPIGGVTGLPPRKKGGQHGDAEYLHSGI